jgi:hypothetical protein
VISTSVHFDPKFLDPFSQSSAIHFRHYGGLAALKKVSDRADLVERVVEWSEGEGREVIDGFRRFQEVLRSTNDDQERERQMEEVRGILSSKFSRGAMITANLVKLGKALLGGDIDLEAAQAAYVLSTSKSY